MLNRLVSCGQCQFHFSARGGPKYSYYVCNGKGSQKLISKNQQCLSRYIPVEIIDNAVWQDLRSLMRDPAIIIDALKYAKDCKFFTHQLQKRNEIVKQNLEQILTQEKRLLDAYLAEVITFEEFSSKRDEIASKKSSLEQQQRQIQAQKETKVELEKISHWLRIFCQDISDQLDKMDLEQRRYIMKLLIDRVVVDDEQVEIRYAIPTSEAGKKNFFCHLRLRYFSDIVHQVSVHSVSL